MYDLWIFCNIVRITPPYCTGTMYKYFLHPLSSWVVYLFSLLQKAVDEARSERDHANNLFHDKKYSECLSVYGKSHMKFDWICANFPHKIPEIEDDIKLLVFNMAIGYYESDVPEGTVECANDAIDIDPAFYQVYCNVYVIVF